MFLKALGKETVDCVAACVSQTDRAANTMWAVSFLFINIVLAISVGIIFMAQSTPGKPLLIVF